MPGEFELELNEIRFDRPDKDLASSVLRLILMTIVIGIIRLPNKRLKTMSSGDPVAKDRSMPVLGSLKNILIDA